MVAEPGGTAICLRTQFAPNMSRVCAHADVADLQKIDEERW